MNNIQDLSEFKLTLLKVFQYYQIKGNEVKGVWHCPFHEDNSPSLVFKNKEPYMFKCMGCGKSGDVISFVALMENLDTSLQFYEILNKITSITGVSLKENNYRDLVTELSKENIEYLKARGIELGAIKYFELKSYKNLIAFPLKRHSYINAYHCIGNKDLNQKPCFIGIDTQSQIFPNYNFNNIETVIITAGEFDCIKLTQEIGLHRDLKAKLNTEFGKLKIITFTTGENSIPADLNRILEFNTIKRFLIFYDNDKTGFDGFEKLKTKLLELGDYEIRRYEFNTNKKGYDVNDFLLQNSVQELFTLKYHVYQREVNNNSLEKSILNYCINSAIKGDFLKYLAQNIEAKYFSNKIYRNVYQYLYYCCMDIGKCSIERLKEKFGTQLITNLLIPDIEFLSDKDVINHLEPMKKEFILTSTNTMIDSITNLVSNKNLAHDEIKAIVSNQYNELLKQTDIKKNEQTLFEAFNNFYTQREDVKIASTPFDNYNRILDGGLRFGGLHIISARAKVGKTTFTTSLFLHMSKSFKCCFFSTEMRVMDLIERILPNLLDKPFNLFRKRHEYQSTKQEAYSLLERFNKNTTVIRDGVNDFNQLKNDLNVKKEQGYDVFFIDNLNNFVNTTKEPNHIFYANIVNWLRAFALDNNKLVILVCQLNRQTDNNFSSRPIASNLSETSSLEKDCTTITFLYRDNKEPNKTICFLGVNRIPNQFSNNDIYFTYDSSRCRLIEYTY